MHELGRIYRDGIGIKRDKKQAAFWLGKAAEEGYLDPDAINGRKRQHANAVGHWILRVFADAALVGCFFAGLNGLSYPRSREDLIGAAYLGILAVIFHALGWYMRPVPQKRAPRWIHIVLGAILAVILLAIMAVFAGGGVVDPEDIWIVGWIAALAALAFFRAFQKR